MCILRLFGALRGIRPARRECGDAAFVLVVGPRSAAARSAARARGAALFVRHGCGLGFEPSTRSGQKRASSRSKSEVFVPVGVYRSDFPSGTQVSGATARWHLTAVTARVPPGHRTPRGRVP